MTFLWLALAASSVAGESPPLQITDQLYHVGDNDRPEWKDITSVKPSHRSKVEIEFDSKENDRKLVLEIQAGGVSEDWKVRLNDKEIGVLKKVEDLTAQYFELPRNALKNGKNKLTVGESRDGNIDDIYVGKAVIHDRPLRDFLGHARVNVLVRDAESGDGMPSRITVTKLVDKKEKEKYKDAEGKEKEREVTKKVEELVDLTIEDKKNLAVRKGILYTRKGQVSFDIPAGEYTLYATRGFEYGVHRERLKLEKRDERAVECMIRREVDTTGYLAADTHIHTKTHSGHGDIDMEERVITIAGEGVEVAVATDHNHHTDYVPTMEKVGVKDVFSTIVGNEVTTPIGHFNAFPFDRKTDPPFSDHTDWVRLVQEMRKASGVRVVIVNHPRRSAARQNAFEMIHLNPLTGEAHSGPEDLGVDAVEILNGKSLDDDRMLTLNDWFGLLNRGYRMKAVAASDSHAVNEIVGQARTYVASSIDDPRKMRVDEVCDSFLDGKLLVSLGLLTSVKVNGKHQVGDFIESPGDELAVEIKVQGPSWTRADRVALYLNGVEVAAREVPPSEEPVKFLDEIRIRTPEHDAHLVAVATGPAITAPFWPIAGGEKKYVMGSTNPVWIDGDRDGKFTCAFEYARDVAARCGLWGRSAENSLAGYDRAVAVQFASIARARIEMEAQDAYRKIMAEADRKIEELLLVKDPAVAKSFKEYLKEAPDLDVRTRSDEKETVARLKKEDDDRRRKRKEAAEKRRKEEDSKRKKRRV